MIQTVITLSPEMGAWLDMRAATTVRQCFAKQAEGEPPWRPFQAADNWPGTLFMPNQQSS